MLNLSIRNYNKVTFNTNTLFYGDNLEILRHLVPNESVDLIYLDSPFNSKADYNILFRETSGEQSTAQIQAFSDFWHWDVQARRAYEYLTVNAPNENLANLINTRFGFLAFWAFLTSLTIFAYWLSSLILSACIFNASPVLTVPLNTLSPTFLCWLSLSCSL